MTRFTGFAAPLTVLAGVAALSAAALPAGAAAQTCTDMVERFAAANGLSTEPPPKAPPSSVAGLPPGTAGGSGTPPVADGSGVTSEELADSGGVIAPPDVGAPAVIEPPPGTLNDMPTAPAIRPDPGMAAAPPSTDTFGRAARQAQMEAMVTGALAAADEGDEARCLDTLAKAEQLAEGGAGTGEPPARRDGQ
ncbi:hypothetical protein [Azospirillum sp. ST 5-10]|uniref:hypothetical protein n=1 Tax=unclassified Azospirillum TaxID=2630922 RepID=UPI003F4A1B15